MAEGWQRDKQRSDIYIPAIKQILGRLFIGEASVEDDRKCATDLLVLSIKPLTFACRMRDASYLEKYAHEITIRYSRDTGHKTEYEKIVDGWGDYFFYGFGDGKRILAYTVVDLRAFRAQLVRSIKDPDCKIKAHPLRNHDGSSWFLAIDTRTLSPECIRHRAAIEKAA